MDPYAQLLMGNALLGPQTNSDSQSELVSGPPAKNCHQICPSYGPGYLGRFSGSAAVLRIPLPSDSSSTVELTGIGDQPWRLRVCLGTAFRCRDGASILRRLAK